MAQYRFGRFHFDATRLALTADHAPVSLRPKTAALLAVLLRSAGQVVSKGDLIDQVWQRRQVQEQSLFQAISELRSTLKPLEAIRTHPNLGYEWVAPLRESAPPRAASGRLLKVAAAVALVALNGLAVVTLAWRPTPPNLASAATSAEAPPSMLPALNAFSLGMTQLSQEDYGGASRYFALATQEHPQFLEAHLMAAEALLAAGDVSAARERANALMLRAESARDRYLITAALDVLSRADLADGDPRAALDWARAAAGKARTEGFACTAVAMEDRVVSIMGALQGQPARGPHGEGPPALADSGIATHKPSDGDRPAHCATITPRTSQRANDQHPTACPAPNRWALRPSARRLQHA